MTTNLVLGRDQHAGAGFEANLTSPRRRVGNFTVSVDVGERHHSYYRRQLLISGVVIET